MAPNRWKYEVTRRDGSTLRTNFSLNLCVNKFLSLQILTSCLMITSVISKDAVGYKKSHHICMVVLPLDCLTGLFRLISQTAKFWISGPI